MIAQRIITQKPGRGDGLVRVARILMFVCLCVCAQARAEVPVAQLVPSSGSLMMGRFVELLEDPGGQLTLEDVTSSRHAGRFVPSGAEQVNLGYSRSAWWLRFCLRGGAGTPPELLMELRFPSVDSIAVYSPIRSKDGTLSYSVKHGGDLRPWAEREVRHRSHVFRLATPEKEEMLYVRVASESVLTLPLYLWQPAAFAENDHDTQLLLGAFYGLVLALVIYNLMLYFSVRDRVYLYYVLYTAVFGIYLFSYDGFAYEYLWPESVWWANHAPATTLSLVLMFGAIFARAFLVLPRIAPRADRVILATAVLGGVFALVAATGVGLDYGVILRCISVIGAFSAVVTLYVCVREVMSGYRPAKFFLLAWSGLLVFILLGTLRNFNLAPANFATIYCLHIGLVLDVLLLSFGLGDRINTMRAEKEAAQAEALATEHALLEATQKNERELEHRVTERTLELNLANEQLRREAGERESLVTQLQESEKRMRFMAQHDALTGLPNRYSMQERLSLAIEVSRRNRKMLAVMLVDLDKFKAVNDTRGHAAGDQLLVAVANRLRTSVRASDTVARLGGDEFVILAGDLDRVDDAAMVAEKVSDMVSLPVPLEGGPWNIACSIGIAMFPRDAETAVDLLARADSAMYAIKGRSGDRARFYSPA